MGIALMKLGVLSGNHSVKFDLCMTLFSFAVDLPANVPDVWWELNQNFTMESLKLATVTQQSGPLAAIGCIALLLAVLN